MKTPGRRGPVSAELLTALSAAPDSPAAQLHHLHEAAVEALRTTTDILRDEDLQLTLFCLNALHYDGLDGVDDAWEWHGGLGAVKLVDRKARIGRNPATGEQIKIPARTAIKITPAKALKDTFNKKGKK